MKIIRQTLAAIGMTLLTTTAFAQKVTTLGEMADLGSSFLPGIGDLMGAIGYVGGVGFCVMSAIAFKTTNEKKESIAKPVIYAICGGLLLALPSFMSASVGSVFGSSGGSSSSSSKY